MHKANDILKQFLNEKNIYTMNMYSDFFKSWENIVGEKLYGHSKIKDISKNILFIDIDHPGWLQLFLMKERELLLKIQKNHPKLGIKSIKFKVTLNVHNTNIKKNNDISDIDVAELPENMLNIEQLQKLNVDDQLKGLLNKLYNRILIRDKKS